MAQFWGRPTSQGFAAARAVQRHPAPPGAGPACGQGAAHTRHARLPARSPCRLLWVQPAPPLPGPKGPRTASSRGNTRPRDPPPGQGMRLARTQKSRPSHRPTPSALLQRQWGPLTGTRWLPWPSGATNTRPTGAGHTTEPQRHTACQDWTLF